jgi:uncharacterized protein (TIGR02246 family)
VDPSQALDAVRPTFEALSTAWENGDGDAFALQCTDDADFVNIIGMHVQGRAAIAELHDKIFKSIYARSTVKFTPLIARILTDDMVLVIVSSQVEVPSGPRQGIVDAIATVLMQRIESRWRIASFQNTKREAALSY